MKDAEDKGLRNWRCELLKNISGDSLELGCGTGANLEFYPPTIKRLVLAEPSPYMNKRLKAKIARYKLSNVEILNDKAESLSLADASFDTVICTLVLCSVNNLEKALSEIHRVLRPQGKLIFIEHVAASDNPKRRRWQHRLEFLWKHIAAGCHTARCTEDAMIKTGFKMIELSHQSMRGVPPIVRPSIRGIAMKIDDIQCGKYQHYKTEKMYEVIGIARHSETHEEMVVYKALYKCDTFGDNQVWVRTKEMFLERVAYDGQSVPRFKWVGE